MAYRKIEVNGKTYEYVVGKEKTKIKGFGTFNNSEFGKSIPIYEVCSCVDYEGSRKLGSNCFAGDPEHIIGYGTAMTPKVIRRIIEKGH